MLVHTEQGPSNESSNFSTMPQLFVFYLCKTTAEDILNCVEKTENKQNVSVDMLLQQNFLAKQLQEGCNGPEHNLIRHLVISLTPHNPSLVLFLPFSIKCPKISSYPFPNLLPLLESAYRQKLIMAKSTLSTKPPMSDSVV